ncbi:DNA-binding response regulator [Chryseobacterium shandongense]|uniref:DNA-binding response regulator n=1 Tax=Chryseobacterium shandongense TaxID=1493872 RepID=A0AAD1DLU1_9FLAO|nr:LytTR family DNA-binding domain-containing protein [Chryseobacterium shandongense]AZA85489.1 DNA-binding response regulator [Chryseobacterium shandongense]AZA97596.1 DNA-binding response regulator [Chryseobacterium shandongense]
MKIIIIEDEIRTAKELAEMLLNSGHEIEITAMLSSVSSAKKWLEENPRPELIFADIELGDGLSFEIFKDLNIEAPVIFCTAFDEYAIRAFESNSIDYLLKPIDQSALQKSLDKYTVLKDHIISNMHRIENLEMAITQMESVPKQTLLISYRQKLIPVKLSDVVYFYSSSGTVSLKLSDESKFTVTYNLDQLESMLDPNLFYRANRQFIVNKNFISNIEYYFNRKLLVFTNLQAPEKIIISRLKAQAFLKWIER